jgi:long-chain acyl-CoA synthetase
MEHLGLVPLINEYNDGKRSYKLKMVAAFSKNREEWLLLEYANILYNNTMIPLYDTLGADGVSFAL